MLSRITGFSSVSVSRDGAVVRVLASHQCVPGSIPGPSATCGLTEFVVGPRCFSPGSLVFPSPQKPTFPNSNSSLESVPISAIALNTFDT